MLALLLGVACDPPASSDAAPPAKSRSESDPKAPAKAAQDEDSTEPDAFTACMDECIGDGTERETDRQTCRLRCEADRPSADGAGSLPATRAVMGRFQTCVDECDADGRTTDAATCRLGCAQSAVAGDGPQALTGPPRGCAITCLEEAGKCASQCSGSKDDAATCRVQCSGVGTHCVDQCQSKTGDDTESPSGPRPAPSAP